MDLEKAREINHQIAFIIIGALLFFIPISASAVEICFGLLLLCFVIGIFTQKNLWEEFLRFTQEPVFMTLAVFFGACALSIFFAPPTLILKSTKALVTKWGEGMLLFVMAACFIKKERTGTLLSIMILSSAVVGLDGMYQKFFGVDFLRGLAMVKTDKFSAVTATFRDYNSFASFLGVVFFIVYAEMRQAAGYFRKGLLGALLALLFLNLLFTYSRGAWLALLLAGGIVYILSGDKSSKVFFGSLAVIFILLAISLPLMRDRILFILCSGGDEQRFLVWRAAWGMFLEAPFFGKGLGLFMDLFPKYAKNVGLQGVYSLQYAHNCYLQILVETGLIGLISFLCFVGQIVLRVVKKIQQRNEPILLGLWAGLLFFLSYSFFDTQLYSLKMSALFWILLGIVVVYTTKHNEGANSFKRSIP